MSSPKDQKQAEAEQTKEFTPSKGKGDIDEVIEISDVDEAVEASQTDDVVVISDVDDIAGKVGKSSDVDEVGKAETSEIGIITEVGKESEIGEVIKGSNVDEVGKIAEREEVGEVSGGWAKKTTIKEEKISPTFFGNFRLQKDETKSPFVNLADEFKEVEEHERSSELSSAASNAAEAAEKTEREILDEKYSAAVATLTEWSWDAEDFFKYVVKPKQDRNDDNNA